MVYDPTSRVAAQDLLDESDVVPSDELTAALGELKSLGERPAPPVSPALAEAMRQAAAGKDEHNVVPLPFGKTSRFGKRGRRGAAVGGAVVLAMAAGMGGVAAFAPGNAVETAFESVIRWVAPAERTEPASDEQPVPVEPGRGQLMVPETPQLTEVPAPAPSQAAPEHPGQSELPAPAPEPEAPATREGRPDNAEEPQRRVVPPVEVPDLPVPIPDPVTTPRSVLPVDPPELPVPGPSQTPAPSERPSR